LRRAKGAAQTVTRMRDFKGMKRQRGRNRGGGGGSGGGNAGGGGKPQQNANRAFESNGPDNVKVRGNAQHVFEKYQQLARDATGAGDRVLAENYLQHAEHYFRLVRAIQPQRPPSEILGRDTFASGYDIDFEDESGTANESYGGGESESSDGANNDADNRDRGGWRDRDERPRDDRQQRDDRPRGDDRARSDERPRDDRQQRDERPRNEDRPRTDERPRTEDRPRADDRPREGRRDRWRERDDRPRDRVERDPLAVVEPQAAPLVVPEDRASPVLRDSDGGESHAPAFLQARVPAAPTEAAAEGEAKPRARRRRAPRSFEGGETPSGETEEV